MLQLRPEQWISLKQDARERFEADLQAHLRSRFPQRVSEIGDAALAELVRSGIARAERYGVVTRMDVRRFVEYMVELGSDFDTDPAYPTVQQILNDPGDSGTRKMDRIDNHATFGRRG